LVIKRCLAKDPDDRWQSAGDLAAGLVWIGQEPAAAPATGLQGTPKSAPASSRWFPASGLLLVIAIALAGASFYQDRSRPEGAVVRFSIPAPEKTVFISGVDSGYYGGSISPNGRKLAFTARDESGKVTLWVRALDALAAQSIPGTDGARMPFWSPDSRT